MKLEELFSTIQSSNGNLSNLPTVSSPPCSSSSSSILNSLPPSNSSIIPPSPLTFSTNSLNTSSSNSLNQLFGQINLGNNATTENKANLFESSLSNQSSHSLLDEMLMKSPETAQNGIIFDDPLLRLFSAQHDMNSTFDPRFKHGANPDSLISRDNTPIQFNANSTKGNILPMTTSLLANINNHTTTTSSSATNHGTGQNSDNSLVNGVNSSSSNTNTLNTLPFNSYFPYQPFSPLSPSLPSPFARFSGPFSAVPPTPPVGPIPSFPFSPLGPVPSGSRPSVAPFPQAQASFNQAQSYRNAAPSPYDFYNSPQYIAYQQYFAYYYNALNNQNQTNPTLPPFNEFFTQSASIAPDSSLSSIEEIRRAESSTGPKKSIRVNVNDLFSISKTLSETNSSQDPKILFDLFQKHEAEQAREMTNSAGGKRQEKKHRNKAAELSQGGSKRAEMGNVGDVLSNKQPKDSSNGSIRTPFRLSPTPSKHNTIQNNEEYLANSNMRIVEKKVSKKAMVKTMPLTKAKTVASQQQKAPKELSFLNENFSLEMLKQWRKDLLSTEQPIQILNRTYDWKKLNYMFTIIKQYFSHIEQRLKVDNVTYLNLIDGTQYVYDDFAAYGARFWGYINESMLFPLETITHYSLLIRKYEELYPKEIIELRTKLLAIKLELSLLMQQRLANVSKSESKPQANKPVESDKSNESADCKKDSSVGSDCLENRATNCPLNYEMITYKQIDPKRLHVNISNIPNIREQIKFFLNNVCLSSEGRSHRDAFIECLNKVLCNSKLAEFGPELHKFGSLSNGLSTYDSDLDIVIKFKNIEVDILDYSTSMLALEVIELILQDQLGIRSKDTIVPSKRCPIIKLNFSVCFPHFKEIIRNELKKGPHLDPIEFNKCDISLITVYGVYNSKMLNFLAKYDRRFYEMALILKYWAKRNELIDTTAFSTYGFTMMLIFFLQNTNPPVLPPISKLQRLVKKQPGKKAIKVHKYNFEFCDDIDMIGKSKNTQSTQELLVEFFRFYIKFDFYNYAISPRLGQSIKKIKLRQEKVTQQLTNFNMSSYICIEDPFVLEHNVGFIFRSRNIFRWNNILRTALYKLSNNNCVRVLVDPGNFQPLRSGPSLIYLPFNLFCHEISTPGNLYTFPTLPSSIKLSEASQMCDLPNSINTMKKFFYLVIRHLLVEYMAIPHHPSAYQLELSADGVTCSVDFGYLSHLNFKLDFRSTNKYDALFQNCRKRTSDCTKRFTLLKTMRDDLRRPPKERNLRDRPVKPFGYLDKWFKIEVARHPLVHQSPISQASHQALVQANSLPVPFYLFRPLIQATNIKFATSNKFGELVFEVLQQFNYSIDRANPTDTFNAYVQEFFSD